MRRMKNVPTGADNVTSSCRLFTASGCAHIPGTLDGIMLPVAHELVSV